MTRPNFAGITIIVLVGFIVAALLSFSNSPLLVAALVMGMLACVITLISTDGGLIILIFSMLLSPEIPIAQVPAREVVIRVDDILLMVIFFTWIAKLAVNKELPFLRHTPVNLPIAMYIITCIIASFKGVITGTVNPVKSFFYILKYIEYFLVFFMVANNVRNLKQAQSFIAFLCVVCFIASLFAWMQIGMGVNRVTMPFEGKESEPNTFGGYLLLMWAVFFGIFWHVKNIGWRIVTGSLCIFMIPPFLFTLSRASYVGFVPMLITFAILNEKRRGLLVLLLVAAVVAGFLFMPESVRGRLHETFIGQERKIAGKTIRLDESAAIRVRTWNKVMVEYWPARPILGFGSGYFLIDGQYLTILAETGLMGLMAFVWILMAILREGMINLYAFKEDDFIKGLSLGFLAGLVGLLIHSLTANSFIIVRIMEPFWFLTAIVVMLRRLKPLQSNEGEIEKAYV